MNTPDIEYLSMKAGIICAIEMSIARDMAVYIYRGILDTWYWSDHRRQPHEGEYPHYQFYVNFAGGIANSEELKLIVEVPSFLIGEEVEILTKEDGWHDGKILDIFIARPHIKDADREYRTDWAGVVTRNCIRPKTPQKAIAPINFQHSQ